MANKWEEEISDAIGRLGGCVTEMAQLAERVEEVRRDFEREANEVADALRTMRNAWRMRDDDDLR